MDLFEESPFAPALPGASTSVELKASPLDENHSQHPFVSHEASSGEPGIREMMRQQWDTLKPLIQSIYIEKNMPFPYLAEVLRDEHGFEPTYAHCLMFVESKY